jgi:hypothetical protein
MATLVKARMAVGAIQDSMFNELARPGNKKDENQAALRASIATQVTTALQKVGMTQAQYDKMLFVIGTDSATRRVYDSVPVQSTGVETPYRLLLARAARGGGGRGGGGGGGGAAIMIPPGPAAAHLGHVANGFPAAPNGAGLLPTAEQEAGTAAQHATLGIAQPSNLEYMKTHAGHVLHALDPATVPTLTGPGAGFGVKRAAEEVANHVDMGAKMPGASPNVVTHAAHIQAAALSAAKRAEQAIAVAKEIQAATSAADAAAAMTRLVALTGQLVTGVDANGDGRIDYNAPEGGLELARTHLNLLVAGEGGGLPPR